MIRVPVDPERLRWARERAGVEADILANRFTKYREWESGEVQPTLRQLEMLATTVHAPIGYFFLSEPPKEPLPIPDFRTVGGVELARPSPNLLSTIYLCQQRQAWYREFARLEGEEAPAFIGSATPESDIETVAAEIRDALRLDLEARRALPTWTDALRDFIDAADELGVLVMVNGIVGNNTHRKLDPDEFRGFALVDDRAPLVFINGADTKAAQMFTLAHELAHLWLGLSALSDSQPSAVPGHGIEAWCNRIAAELLVPLAVLREEYRAGEDIAGALIRLTRRFKVSSLVILRRIYDVGGIDRDAFRTAYRAELDRGRALPTTPGGNFYPTLVRRVGRRFGQALVSSTWGGRTSFSESLQLLGIKKTSTLREFGESLGFVT